VEVRRDPCVPGNAVPCIPRARPQRVRVLWVLVRGFRLRGRLVLAADRELPRAGPANAMFRVA